MRKMVFGRKFSRGKKAREALLRSLIRAIVVSGKITTTAAKAKAVSGQIDKLITLAKESSLAGRRRVLAYLGNDRETVDIIFNSVVRAFDGRESGFTRIVPLPPRRGDAAKMARIEWVEKVIVAGAVKVKDKKAKETIKK